MKHPNIIVICSDQHRADTIGAYGSTDCRTPTLDRLAAGGVTFERCFANNPVCSPSRATIVTGCQSRRHGVTGNGIPCRTDMPTFADILKGNGYRTASIGKMHLMPHGRGPQTGPYYGFDHFENSEDPKLGPFLEWALKEYPEYEGYFIGTLFNLPTDEDYWRGKRDFRKEVEPCREKCVRPHEISKTCNWGYAHYSPLPEEAHQTTWITDRAISLVEGHDTSQPLLLWVGYQDPHNPFDPPGRYRDMYDSHAIAPPFGIEGDDSLLPPHLQTFREACREFTQEDWLTQRALYYGAVTFMDHSIGRLISMLEAKLDMENTIVVYTADHGEHLGDHGICGKSAYHYDAGIRVPMIWRWDGRFAAGTTSRDIVELADFAPTLLQAAGVDHDAIMDGRSYLPLLDGKGSTFEGRGHAYVESYAGAPMDPTPPPRCWPRTIRSDRWRCTFYPDADYGELYDLENDPRELDNLWWDESHHATVEAHRRLLTDRLILMDFPSGPKRYDV